MVVSSYNHCHIHQWCVLYRGSLEKWQIWVQWRHFWRLLVTVDFDDSFNTKVWLFHHIIIVIYINGVCYRGSLEKWQIWVQWWHFWRLLVTVDFDDNFNTKVWSFHHIIIVIYINDVYYIGGLQKSGKFGCSGDTFGGCWLLLVLMIVSTQKYGRFIV